MFIITEVINSRISPRITTDIRVYLFAHRNYNCFNEPFAVSPKKSLYLHLHGLIFKTSIWLLAGSTRLLNYISYFKVKICYCKTYGQEIHLRNFFRWHRFIRCFPWFASIIRITTWTVCIIVHYQLTAILRHACFATLDVVKHPFINQPLSNAKQLYMFSLHK
jgi:hypothetical protein